MKIRRQVKRVLEYIFIPLIMAVIVYLIIFVAVRPVMGMASNIVGMVFSNNAPDFKDGLSSIYDENIERPKEGEVDAKSIQFPGYETQYATISCSRLNMNVPLYWGDTDEVFRAGAGQYIGSFLPGYGGVILAGAHDSMYFAPLENIEVGDIFVVKTNYGEFQYKVSDIKIEKANDSVVYDDSENGEKLVLYTCYPFGALIGVKNQRFYVFADKISGPTVVKETGGAN